MAGLVFDLGGTHLRAATVGADGLLMHVEKHRVANFSQGLAVGDVWNDVRARLFQYVNTHLDHTPARSPLVLAFPGPIDESGRILQAPTLTGVDAEVPNLRDELQRAAGRPVYLINDLSAAAWYISRTVASRFLVVTVSSGIGSKLYDPGFGVFDDVAYAGEIGHCTVDFADNAPRCDCGGRGHLGGIASGRGMERHARLIAHRDPHAFALSHCVTRLGATASTLSNEVHLVPALRADDPWAVDIVGHCAQFLARLIVHAIMTTGLRHVFIIGGFALAAGAPYLSILRTAAEQCCDYGLLKGRVAPMISFAQLGDEACLAGAAIYGMRLQTT